MVEFVGHDSIARLRKPATRQKDLGDICYISGIIAHFSQISLPWQRGSYGGKFK